MSLENLSYWGRRKGLDLISTGDFTHPIWFTELKHSLTECEDGIYEFNDQKFVLGIEVSCVAKDRGRTRKVHILILASSLESSMRITRDLSYHSKTLADGRLTVRLTPSELLELSLQSDSESLIIPSHIWTPWYGLLGSRSGYNSLEECFREKHR